MQVKTITGVLRQGQGHGCDGETEMCKKSSGHGTGLWEFFWVYREWFQS